MDECTHPKHTHKKSIDRQRVCGREREGGRGRERERERVFRELNGGVLPVLREREKVSEGARER